MDQFSLRSKWKCQEDLSEFSHRVDVSLIYLMVLVWVILGERIRDSFKCVQMIDGLLRDETGGTVLWKSKNRNHGVAGLVESGS